MIEIEKDKEEPVKGSQSMTYKTCICPVHGDIGQAILSISVINSFSHIYCMHCFDEFLTKNKIPLVDIIEKQLDIPETAQ